MKTEMERAICLRDVVEDWGNNVGEVTAINGDMVTFETVAGHTCTWPTRLLTVKVAALDEVPTPCGPSDDERAALDAICDMRDVNDIYERNLWA
jgi:hypothetical protein